MIFTSVGAFLSAIGAIPEAEVGPNFLDKTWFYFTRVLDPGTMGGDADNLVRFLSTVATLLGADPLAERMASAATSTLREGSQARVADDAKCKQELGKSGVGERSHSNDRDTFMSSYIGAGKDCKK